MSGWRGAVGREPRTVAAHNASYTGLHRAQERVHIDLVLGAIVDVRGRLRSPVLLLAVEDTTDQIQDAHGH